jgi:nucleoside 2-deoxyribosyltransferase
MKPSVYLAGPIAGLHYDAAQDWRSAVRDALAPEIDAFSPLRSKEYLRKEGVLRDQYAYAPLSSDRGITTRDHFDCQRCDIIFCNLLGANSVSIGTVMEIAWSYSYSKPLVLLMEPSGNIHDHPMVREATGFRVESLEQGVEIARAVLLPRRPGA